MLLSENTEDFALVMKFKQDLEELEQITGDSKTLESILILVNAPIEL